MTTHPDHEIAALAARQDGVFSRRQARAAGLSDSTIARRVASGSWQRVRPSLYTVAGWTATGRQLLWIGVLGLDGAVVSRSSAARLHELTGVVHDTPSVTVLHGHRPDPIPGLTVHETRRLHRLDRCEIQGMPATTAARTIIDLAAEVTYYRLAHIIDQAHQTAIADRLDVLAALRSITRRGRPGCRNLRRYFDHRLHVPTVEVSELEYRFDRLVARAGLPPADPQHRPPWYDGIRGTVDRCWPDHHLIVELDGRSFHSTMQAFTDDRRRDRLAQQHGFRVLRFSYEEVTRRGDEVLDDLRPFLSRSGSVDVSDPGRFDARTAVSGAS